MPSEMKEDMLLNKHVLIYYDANIKKTTISMFDSHQELLDFKKKQIEKNNNVGQLRLPYVD